jgi:nitrite reductase/ring-hydroxylating ferredoxin subunit
MLLSAGEPLRSIRWQPHGGEELLMVGGESHDVGTGDAEPARYGHLIEFARQHWPVESIEHRWSTQDFIAADEVPFAGRLHPLTHSVWVATGLRKWGMTNGTVAAELIRDGILGREHPAAGLFSSLRVSPRGQGPTMAMENTKVATHFIGDRLRERGGRPIEDLAPGEGGIVAGPSGKVAGYRDPEGTLHAVSSRCTHLGCQLRFNEADVSWDCPCHASRFSVDGELLNGPATKPLARKPTGD